MESDKNTNTNTNTYANTNIYTTVAKFLGQSRPDTLNPITG